MKRANTVNVLFPFSGSSPFIDRKAGAELPPCLQVINSHDILQKWIIKRENRPAQMKTTKEMQSDNAENEIGVEHGWNYS